MFHQTKNHPFSLNHCTSSVATPETERAVRPATQLACTPQSIHVDVGDPTPSEGDEKVPRAMCSTSKGITSHHSEPLVRVMAFDVEHITFGTFSSPSEGVSPTTSVFIDSVMHASCYACNSLPMTLVMLCLNTSRRLLKVSCAVHSFMLLRLQGRLTRREGQCPQVTPKKAGRSMPSGNASKGGRVQCTTLGRRP